MDDPDLTDSEPGVVRGDPVFNYDGNNYSLEIFGIAEADPSVVHPPFLICRRYEVNNTSGQEIPHLKWPDISVPIIDSTPSGKRYRFPRDVLHNSTDVGVSPTTLYAWENIPALSKTVFPVTVKKATKAGTNWMYTLGSESLFGVEGQIFGDGQYFDATQAFYAPAESFSYPTLRAGLQTDDVSLMIYSRAEASPSDSWVNATIEIKVSTTREGELKFFAPGIAALVATKFEVTSSIADRVARYSKTLGEFGVPADNNSLISGGLKISYSMIDVQSQPIMFVTDQPIKLSIGEWSVCLEVSVYGPVPVSLSGDVYCDVGG